MPERCPICGLEIAAELPTPDQCQHLPHEREIATLAQKVTMLEGAIEGWRELEKYRAWVFDHFASGDVACECVGCPDGCTRGASDVWVGSDDATYALCAKCLKPSHGRSDG